LHKQKQNTERSDKKQIYTDFIFYIPRERKKKL